MDYENLAADMVEKALDKGVEAAEAFVEQGGEFTVDVMDGEVENLVEAVSKGVGVRLFKQGRMAFFSTSDFRPGSLAELLDQAAATLGFVDPDPAQGLPEVEPALEAAGELDIYDPSIEALDTGRKIELTAAMEAAARDADPRIRGFRQSRFKNGYGTVWLANSLGAARSFKQSYCYLVTAPMAQVDDERRINWWYSVDRSLGNLKRPEDVGRKAAERTVGMLGSGPVASGRFPVVVDPVVGSSLISEIASLAYGSAIYRRSSVFTDKLGEKIGSDAVTIIDDGTIPGGLGSQPFDGEGVPTSRKPIIDRGVLANLLYNTYWARKTGARSTGNARRRYNTLPSTSTMNLYMAPGEYEPEDIIAGVDQGLYLTATMGSGLNSSTGDFSVGAEGFWISNGELGRPVSEITIAGNIMDVLAGVRMVGNDLVADDSEYAPTFRIEELTIAGSGEARMSRSDMWAAGLKPRGLFGV